MQRSIKKEFFARDARAVARDLLGKKLVYKNKEGMIVETEAYKTDAASHAERKITPRNEIMYTSYGKIYVYFIYGNHWCMNFTCEKNSPAAVLIRGLEPLRGIRKRTDGPGKLCAALGIDGKLLGAEIGKEIKLYDYKSGFEIATSGRIGIKKAMRLPWRFYIKGNKFVSKKS